MSEPQLIRVPSAFDPRFAFSYLLLPGFLSSRNRARRSERGDLLRAGMFGVIGLGVCAVLFAGSFWLTWRWRRRRWVTTCSGSGCRAFLKFLSFLAFSGVVTALSTFFLSEDLRLLLAAPVATRRIFYARFARTLGQSSWMVVVFLIPALLGVGLARCAPPSFYATAILTIVPFVIIPVGLGTAVTLLLVNTFPARRARDILMLMGFLFAGSIVLLLRFIRPERLMKGIAAGRHRLFCDLHRPSRRCCHPSWPARRSLPTFRRMDFLTLVRCGRPRWR